MSEEREFETEVIRIARAIWDDDGGGAVMESGRERDGVFITNECVHIVECTVSTRKDKAVDDTKKIVQLAEEMRRRYADKGVKGWFITKIEPTADQRSVVLDPRNKNIVVALSFHSFQAKFINGREYLSCRNKHRFGSSQNPHDGNFSDLPKYIPIDLPEPKSGKLWDIGEISNSISAGKRFSLLGDYGVGKSMTLHQLYLILSRDYLASRVLKFPVYINLREHHGQPDPAEILERHARSIGFNSPGRLVRA